MHVSELLSESLLCEARYTTMRMNSLIYSLSLLPSSGARKHSLRLLMKSLTELWDQTFTNIQALIEPLFIRANYLILSRSDRYKFPTLLSLENLTSINLK